MDGYTESKPIGQNRNLKQEEREREKKKKKKKKKKVKSALFILCRRRGKREGFQSNLK